MPLVVIAVGVTVVACMTPPNTTAMECQWRVSSWRSFQVVREMVGNEPDQFQTPPNAAACESWHQRMASVVREYDTSHAITCGLHHASL